MAMKRYRLGDVTHYVRYSKWDARATTSDGKTYHAKSILCRKSRYEGKVNRTWVGNEVVYGTYADVARLRIPDWCLIDYGEITFFGSEMVAGRSAVRDDDVGKLSQVVKRDDNFWQVVRCLLLDVALLNSDRPASNVLLENETVWFFDHTGALWGSGHGDLWRLDPNKIGEKTPGEWFQDYLKGSTLNRVWHDPRMTCDALQWHFQALPLATCHLERARQLMPDGWLRDGMMQKATRFLPKWWDFLNTFLQRPDAIDAIRQCADRAKER
jgi:hypothetical protein